MTESWLLSDDDYHAIWPVLMQDVGPTSPQCRILPVFPIRIGTSTILLGYGNTQSEQNSWISLLVCDNIDSLLAK